MKNVRGYMKKIIVGIFSLLILLFTFSPAIASEEKTILFFYGIGCPHCVQVEEYFEENDFYEKYPIEGKEIYQDRANALLFNEIMDDHKIPVNQRGVPAVVIGDEVIVGDTPIIRDFEEKANKYLGREEKKDTKKESAAFGLTLPMVLGASLVDAINPCAFAVLILLMTAILAAGSSSKALKAGLAFAASIFISYFLMGLGLYRAISLTGGLTGSILKFLGVLAIILGLFNLKDWLWYGKGFLMEVPMSWRPRLKKLIGSVTSPMGAFFVGFLVSLFLLPCTSGPYIVILGLLAQNAFDQSALLYLFIYNLVFVLPMIIITILVYKGLDVKKAEEERQKRLRVLHLIAGVILILMGIAILFHWV